MNISDPNRLSILYETKTHLFRYDIYNSANHRFFRVVPEESDYASFHLEAKSKAEDKHEYVLEKEFIATKADEWAFCSRVTEKDNLEKIVEESEKLKADGWKCRVCGKYYRRGNKNGVCSQCVADILSTKYDLEELRCRNCFKLDHRLVFFYGLCSDCVDNLVEESLERRVSDD